MKICFITSGPRHVPGRRSISYLDCNRNRFSSTDKSLILLAMRKNKNGNERVTPPNLYYYTLNDSDF